MNTHLRALGLTFATTVLASSLALAAGTTPARPSHTPHTQLAMADSGDMDKKPTAMKKPMAHKKTASHRKHAKKHAAKSHKMAAHKAMAKKK